MLANIGVPMLAIELPVLVIALIPIILLEASIYVQDCRVAWSSAWRGTAAANVLSALVGVPAAWFLQVVLQGIIGAGGAWGLSTPLLKLGAVTVQSAWLIPYESDLDWMVPAAALFLLFPAFAVSVLCEAPVMRHWFRESTSKNVFAVVCRANLASYCLLGLFWGTLLTWRLAERL